MSRLCIFLPSLGGGGAERALTILANELARRGVHVDLVLARRIGPYLDIVAPSVNIVDLGKKGVMASIPGLAAHIRRERPDAVLSAMTHANIAAIAARRLANVPTRLVISERSSLVGVRQGRAGWLMDLLMRLTYRNADAVTVVATAMIDELESALKMPRSKIHPIYNPVVTADLVRRSMETPDHGWLTDGGPPVILTAGRLSPEKDHRTLIEAFHRLRRRTPARLMLLGEGGEQPQLQQLTAQLGLADAVAFPGFASNPYAYMHRASLFVLSSRFEGLPNALIEAMACGAPVVSTDCRTGPAEILENGRWGRLTPVGDVEALANAMFDALTDTDPPDVRARAAMFSEARAADLYSDVLGLNVPHRADHCVQNAK